MLDQLIIGEKASLDDFGASLAKRAISSPAKKEIKETVPFSNITYDFSAINGELYWEERELQYVFEIIADSPADLERKKIKFSNWIMNVMNENIYDPYEPDFHYVGTFEDMSYSDEDNIEKTTATVTFTAYPYKVANEPTVYVVVIYPEGDYTVVIKNDSAHRITPTVIASAAVIATMDGISYSFPAGTVTDNLFRLSAGENNLTFKNTATEECSIEIRFYREVF